MTKLIKSADEHDAAIQRIAKLMERDPAPGTPAGDELEVLSHLVSEYEKKHHDIGLPDPLTAIRFRMEQQGLRAKDLAPYLGGANRVSEVLAGKRTLTVPMIRRLHNDLGIPAEVLVQDRAAPTKAADGFVARFSATAFKEVFQRGWFRGFHGSYDAAKQCAESLLERFFLFGSDLGWSACTHAPEGSPRRDGRSVRIARLEDSRVAAGDSGRARGRIYPFKLQVYLPSAARWVKPLKDWAGRCNGAAQEHRDCSLSLASSSRHLPRWGCCKTPRWSPGYWPHASL